MVCPKCGAESLESEDVKFCGGCGTSLGGGEETSTGLEQNLAGLLCYVLAWLTGLIFILLEKENDFVRFHAMQSIVAFGVLTVAGIALVVLGYIPYIGILFDILGWLLLVLGLAIWILLMFKASQGERYRLPWAGDFAQTNMPNPRRS